MKIYAFNGSPRKTGNSVQMMQTFIEGLKEANPNVEVEIVNLYDYNYTGCRSCFACQMTVNRDHLGCQIKDDIHDILEAARQADGIVFASPIYFFDITAQLKTFLERLFYPGKSEKPVPSVFLYTMNAPEEIKDQLNFECALTTSRSFMESNFLEAPECVYAFNTFQYNDKEIFTEHFRRFVPMKLENRKKQFPTDLKNAYEAGVRLVARIHKVAELNA